MSLPRTFALDEAVGDYYIARRQTTRSNFVATESTVRGPAAQLLSGGAQTATSGVYTAGVADNALVAEPVAVAPAESSRESLTVPLDPWVLHDAAYTESWCNESYTTADRGARRLLETLAQMWTTGDRCRPPARAEANTTPQVFSFDSCQTPGLSSRKHAEALIVHQHTTDLYCFLTGRPCRRGHCRATSSGIC